MHETLTLLVSEMEVTRRGSAAISETVRTGRPLAQGSWSSQRAKSIGPKTVVCAVVVEHPTFREILAAGGRHVSDSSYS